MNSEFCPISSFKDHPSLRNQPTEFLYLCDNQFYHATCEGLYKVNIRGIDYSNLGEPYREFAEIQFSYNTQYGSMKIEFEDAAYLVCYFAFVLNTPLILVSDEVTSHKDYKRLLAKLSARERV